MGTLNNIKWVALSQFSKIFCQIISLVFLARLMPPSEYGLIAMAGVIVALGMLFRDMGTSAALIQKRNISESLKNAVFYINCIVGLFVGLVITGIAPWVANYFNQIKLINVLMILAATFPIASLVSTQKALMEKESRFKLLAYIETISISLSTFACLIAAYAGWGVYSLVVQAILNSILSTILIWIKSNWKPHKFRLSILRDVKGIFHYSGNLVAFNSVNYFYRNADRYIIGKAMTSAVLGSYDLAYKIMLFPIQALTAVIARALFPIFSDLQDQEDEFNKVFVKTTILISFFSFPMLTGLMALSEDFVYMVYGNEWLLVSSLLIWLSPVGMIQSLGSSTGSVLMAKGRTDILFKLGCLGALLTVSGFFIAVSISNDIVLFCKIYLISNLINFLVATYVVCRILSLKTFYYYKCLVPIFLSSFFMYLFIFYMNSIFAADLFGFFSKISLGLIVYLVLMRVFSNDIINEIFKNFSIKLSKVF